MNSDYKDNRNDYHLLVSDFPNTAPSDVPDWCEEKTAVSDLIEHQKVVSYNNWLSEMSLFGDISAQDAADGMLKSPLDGTGLDIPLISPHYKKSSDSPNPNLQEMDRKLSDRFPAILTVYPSGISVRPRMVSGGSSSSGGGKRGNIFGFSESSRSRMRALLLRLDMSSFLSSGKSAKRAKSFFLTLTYPNNYPVDWNVYKANLEAFKERLRFTLKKLGLSFSAIWKLEFQRRGAPHFHLLIFVSGDVSTAWLRHFVSKNWTRIISGAMDYDSDTQRKIIAVHRGDVANSTGSCAVPLYGSKGVGRLVSYLLKYMTKTSDPIIDPETGELIPCGRVWGIWYKENLPYAMGYSFSFTSYSGYRNFVMAVRQYGSFSIYLSSLSGKSPFRLYGAGSDILLELLEYMNYPTIDSDLIAQI